MILITREMLDSKKMSVQRINGVDTVCKRNGKPYKIQQIGPKHPWGKEKNYDYISISWQGKNCLWAVHRIIYAWYKGKCDEDLTINHIDNNQHNNNIENLELITLQDNLKLKKACKNQYSAAWTDEEAYTYKVLKENVITSKRLLDAANEGLAMAMNAWRLESNPETRAEKKAAKEYVEQCKLNWRKAINDREAFRMTKKGQ